VNAVSSLAAAAAATILGGGGGKPSSASFPLVVSGDLPWAEAYNTVSSQLATLTAAKSNEVDAVDEAVAKLASVLDSGTGNDEEAVRSAAQEVEKRTEELAARLDRLSDAVNGVFRAALRLRNAELGSFAAGPAEKTRKK
jgi:ABC-type transporter Mla subunit MlaD